MALLGLGHSADFTGAATAPEHVELTLIDSCCSVLAGMIDAQHSCDLFARLGIARQPVWVFHSHAVSRQISACRRGARRRQKTAQQTPTITREANRFHPASEIPHSDHAGSSQRTGIWPRMRAFNASTVSAAVAAPVQALGPANQCRSTPTW